MIRQFLCDGQLWEVSTTGFGRLDTKGGGPGTLSLSLEFRQSSNLESYKARTRSEDLGAIPEA